MADNPYDSGLNYSLGSPVKKPNPYIMNMGVSSNFGTDNTPVTGADTKINPSLDFGGGGNPTPGSGSGLGGLLDSLGGMDGLSKFGSAIGGIMTAMNGHELGSIMRDQYNTAKANTNIGLDNQGRIANTTNGIQGYLRGGAQGLTGNSLNAFNDKYVQEHALSSARV
jgi:hypothetical protein